MALSPNALRILGELGIDLIKEGIAMPYVLFHHFLLVLSLDRWLTLCRLNQIVLHHSSHPDKFLVHAKNIFPNTHTVLWVERGPLVDILLDHFYALGGRIDYDSEVVNIDRHPDGAVVITLSTNRTCVGEYIVGADGIHSNVRKWLYIASPPKQAPRHSPLWEMKLFGLLAPLVYYFEKFAGGKESRQRAWEAIPTPWTALYGITTRLPDHLLTGGEEGPNATGTMHWYLGDVPGAYSTNSLQNGRVFWVCYQNEPLPTYTYYTEREAKETMHAYSNSPYCTTLPSKDGTMPAEIGLSGISKKAHFQDIYSRSEKIMKVRLHHTFFYEISDRLKRIVLIGDAAHPMNTFHGQGAGMAIEEGLVLCNGLLRAAWAGRQSRLTVDENLVGIRYYEDMRMKRNERVSNLGWWFGMGIMGDWWLLRKVRDVALAWALRGPTPSQIETERERARVERDERFGVKTLVGNKLRSRVQEDWRRERTPRNWLFDHVIEVEDEGAFWANAIDVGAAVVTE